MRSLKSMSMSFKTPQRNLRLSVSAKKNNGPGQIEDQCMTFAQIFHVKVNSMQMTVLYLCSSTYVQPQMISKLSSTSND